MTENIPPTIPDQRVPRPTGVWFFTIYAAIFAGVAPLVMGVILLFTGNTGGNEIGLLLALPLNLGVILSAIGTWQGKEKARKTFLWMVALNYVLIAVNNIVLITSGVIPEDAITQSWGRVIRGVLYPALFIWYFNRYTTKEFYQ